MATGLHYVVLIGLVRWLQMDPVRASAIGFVGSACLNYFANYRFTFASAESHARAGPKFAVLASLGLALNSEILAMLIGAGFHYMVAQAAATVLVLLWNFVGNSLWTFRRSHRRAAAPS